MNQEERMIRPNVALECVPDGPTGSARKERDAIIICDLDERVTYVNEQTAVLFGIPAGDAIGRNVGEILRLSAESPVLRDARQLLKIDGEWSGRLQWKGPEGGTTIVSSVWTLVRDGNDAPMSILIVSRDVNDDGAHQNAMERRRLENLGCLAVGIAHHLNDIFAPVLLAIERSKQGVRKAASVQPLVSAREYLQDGADLVSQILAFAARERGVRSVLKPALLLRSVEGMLRRTLPKSTRVVVESPELKSKVLADGTRLFQVLLDLALRVYRQNQEAGTVFVATSEINPDAQWSRMMNLSPAAFYVIFSISSSSKRKAKSPIIRQDIIDGRSDPDLNDITEEVEALGGFFRIRKGHDPRNEYQMLFPAHGASAAQSPANPNADRTPGNGEIILVVDDEPAIRESTRMTLIANGYRVLTAGDGAEAVALYAEHSKEIAAVLMDIMMPYMSGDAAIRTILQINPEARIVAVSGYTTSDKLAHIIDLEHVVMIQKPYTSQMLQNALRRVLVGTNHDLMRAEGHSRVSLRRKTNAGI